LPLAVIYVHYSNNIFDFYFNKSGHGNIPLEGIAQEKGIDT
jgi:hypothetical protein